MVKEFIRNAKFDEIYPSDEYETITYYFETTVDALEYYLPYEKYSEAIGCAISIEFNNKINPRYGDVMISPMRKIEDGTEEYDYNYVNMEYEDIEELINKVRI